MPLDAEQQGNYLQSVRLKVDLSEMKSVLKRIHRGISERSAISYAAAETGVHQRLSFTLQRSNAYSISLQSTAATRGS
jgi:hypothetical protein